MGGRACPLLGRLFLVEGLIQHHGRAPGRRLAGGDVVILPRGRQARRQRDSPIRYLLYS